MQPNIKPMPAILTILIINIIILICFAANSEDLLEFDNSTVTDVNNFVVKDSECDMLLDTNAPVVPGTLVIHSQGCNVGINLNTGEVQYDCNLPEASKTFWETIQEAYFQTELYLLRKENAELKRKLQEGR